MASKYFYGECSGNDAREGSARPASASSIDRVTRTIADWGRDDGYFATADDAERFYDELTALCLNQYGSFNSPVWFNVGLYHRYGIAGAGQQLAVGRGDPHGRPGRRAPTSTPRPRPASSRASPTTWKDIMRLAHSEAMLFKFGSGTGTDLSTLRSSREKLSGGGKPSGPVSFMRVYDAIASVVKSGGKTRRAAKMQTLKFWHPDILEFIECKTKEEKKAQTLIRAGYEANFNGEAYSSVMFQNANLSVRVHRRLPPRRRERRRVDHPRRHHRPARCRPTRPSMLLDKIAEGTWLCGDPGMQYEDTIQRWHTCPNTAPINSSNPCSEYMFIDDSACNLASINLMKFRREDGTFDVERFRAACGSSSRRRRSWSTTRATRPTGSRPNSHKFRPLGLGYANLGSLLMAVGPAVRLGRRAGPWPARSRRSCTARPT